LAWSAFTSGAGGRPDQLAEIGTTEHADIIGQRIQAQDLLDEARRLRPGRARNELRPVAKVMRNPNPRWILIRVKLIERRGSAIFPPAKRL
jgi:hypothetical protein